MSKADEKIDTTPSEVEVEDTQEGKFLTFFLGEEEYGIEIQYVTEIIGIQTMTDLPDTPSFMKGVINLRGKLVQLIDVRLRFNLEERRYNDRTCIVVVNVNEMSVGLIADAVSEVIDISESQIEAPPKMTNKAGSRYIQGLGKVGENVKILLDMKKLLFEEDVESTTNSSAL